MYRHRLLSAFCLCLLIALVVPGTGMSQTNPDPDNPAPIIVYGSTTVDPDWIPPIWRLPVTICVTNLVSATVSVRDVDLSTVRINETLAPNSAAIVVEASEPACWTLKIRTYVQELGKTYADRHVPVEQPYIVSGKLVNGVSFEAEGTLSFYALYAGDLDGSGTTDMTDLRQMVDYLFKGSPQPKKTANGDMDRDGGMDLSDLNHLLDYLF